MDDSSPIATFIFEINVDSTSNLLEPIWNMNEGVDHFGENFRAVFTKCKAQT